LQEYTHFLSIISSIYLVFYPKTEFKPHINNAKDDNIYKNWYLLPNIVREFNNRKSKNGVGLKIQINLYLFIFLENKYFIPLFIFH
jgi:hypothetical protein